MQQKSKFESKKHIWYGIACTIAFLFLSSGSSAKQSYPMNEGTANILQQSQKTHRVTGKVVDSNGEPIIGASVIEKGTTNGAATDVDGKFSLTVANSSVLTVSYVGFGTAEVTVGNKTVINVTLTEDEEALGEVVVVGYGVQKKESVTGSIASIQSKDLESTKTANVTNALAGKLPGLRAVQRTGAPGDDAASIDIRGFGSALVIVDGIERSFSDIDANDIESISVLKDASASVYGFKGANGVILVTTKKGNEGKAKINYNGYVGFQQVTRYPKLMNAYEYASLYNEAQLNIGAKAPYSDEQLLAYQNGEGTDWYAETIRNAAPMQSHNMSVSGGNSKVKYYFSLGYLGQESIYRSNDYSYNRYNVRSNISAEIVKGLTIDLKLSGRLDARNKPWEEDMAYITRSIQMAIPTFSIYANGNTDYFTNPGDKGNPVQNTIQNEVGYNNRDRREFNGSIALTWKLPWVKGLSAKGMFSYDYINTATKNWYRESYAYAYSEASDSYSPSRSHTLSTLTQRKQDYYRPNGQISLNYNNTFGQHNIGALLLYEFYNDHTDWIQAYREFPIAAIDQINAGSTTNINNGGTTSETAHKGLVGRVNYAYANKYLAEVSFRYDGSYKFDPSQRWGFFPAVSLGWRVSEEAFFKNALPMVDNFKIRGSYGKIGDEMDFNAFQFQQGYTYPSGSYVLGSNGVTNGAADTGMPNTALTWYKSTTANIGFEASAYKGLISVEFDYFIRNRDGLLATRLLTLPTTFGQALPQENLNSDRTRGWELSVGHQNRIGEFTYEVRANFSTTRNYYRYVERAESANMYDNWRNNTNDRVKDITWGYVTEGQFQNYEEILNSPIQDGNGNKSVLPGDLKFKDLNNDGIIDDKDQEPIGRSSIPQMYYGLNLAGAYKGFDATIFFQGAAGHHVFTTGDIMNTFIQQGLGNGLQVWTDRWHRADSTDPASAWIPGEMPAVRVAGYSNNARTCTWTRQNGSYLRLKTIEVGYTLPKTILHHVGIEKLRVYVNALNLLTFSSNRGFMKFMDPENNQGHIRYYPQMKTYNFGVNLTF